MKMFCIEDQEIDEDVLHRRSGQHGIAELEKTYIVIPSLIESV
jgi:hypothetical protein